MASICERLVAWSKRVSQLSDPLLNSFRPIGQFFIHHPNSVFARRFSRLLYGFDCISAMAIHVAQPSREKRFQEPFSPKSMEIERRSAKKVPGTFSRFVVQPSRLQNL
jgi:hypothetical protein